MNRRRAAHARPTIVEFFDRLSMPRSEIPLLRRYYCTLRRRGLGQTTALVGGLLALDVSQREISYALGCGQRRVTEKWGRIRRDFSLNGVGSFVRFLEVRADRPNLRRLRPTPQERPFARFNEFRASTLDGVAARGSSELGEYREGSAGALGLKSRAH